MAKAKTKRTAKCKVPVTKKFNGKSYKAKKTTYKTKKQATTAAVTHRGRGKNKAARVVPNPCGTGFKVYTRG